MRARRGGCCMVRPPRSGASYLRSYYAASALPVIGHPTARRPSGGGGGAHALTQQVRRAVEAPFPEGGLNWLLEGMRDAKFAKLAAVELARRSGLPPAPLLPASLLVVVVHCSTYLRDAIPFRVPRSRGLGAGGRARRGGSRADVCARREG